MIAADSSCVVSTRLAAAVMQAPIEVSRAGRATTSRRRLRVASSRARARARPMWPWLARAAYAASASETRRCGRGTRRRPPRPGRREGEVAAPRADGRQDVLGGRRAQQPHGAVGRLLDRLEQRVARRVGEPVGVLDDHHLPARADRRERRPADEVADVVDADRQLLGAHHGDVGVGRASDGAARMALAAAVLRSHWRAAANATAALERPEPGGPVKSQAWVIPRPPAAAPRTSITCG